MKIRELKENEPLEVIEVYNHYAFPNLYTGKTDETSHIYEYRKIQMKIFTDGEIVKETDEITQNIDEYYIGKKKYQYDVDTLKTKNIYFKNYSYVIVYLIANEGRIVGHIGGWFDIVKDVSIYLENSRDKKALKCAKEVIREIENRNMGVDYSSIWGMLFSQREELQKFEQEEISKNVYSLKKVRYLM